MTRTTARAHYVTHNQVTRVPRAHIYLDSEAHNQVVHNGAVQSFRLAVTAFDRKKHDGEGWRAREWGEHLSTDGMWAWIDERTQARARTVLVAHNLAYDLRITDAFGWLPAHGWKLKAIRLNERQAWCTWKRDDRTLVMVDSMAWIPMALDKIGQLLEIPKLALPAWADDDETWFARCRRDVLILAEAWRRMLGFIETADLGNWKPTGAGQAWAAYRHRFMHHHLFVHEDDDARDAERAASFTGRCEAWKHGRLTGGPFTEWDFSNAYATIGAECAVPVKLHGAIWPPSLATLDKAARKCAVLADVTVTTDTPTVPMRHGDGIVWPVGTFTTTLWNNELQLARANGADVSVQRAWWYRRAPALEEFCRWVLDTIDPRTVDTDPIVRAMLKMWGRSLIGRTAARWSTWVEWGASPHYAVTLGKAHDVSAGEHFDLLQAGHQLFKCTDVAENPDAMVSVMSWVMAEARVRLWGAMESAGFENVAYVDTDSMIVNAAGHDRLLVDAPAGLRVKGAWRSVEVLGPRQLVQEGALKAAGVPRDARRLEPGVWQGDVWSGLSASLRAGERDRVRIAGRRFTVAGTDHRRVHVAGGLTAPRTIVAASDIPATKSA